jgi:hypothetical protein
MNRADSLEPRSPGGERYQIRVGQHLDHECSAWLAGLTINNLEGGEAILSGTLVDQSALYGVLQCLRDLHVPLIDVRRGNMHDDTEL